MAASIQRKRFIARTKRALRHMMPGHIVKSRVTASMMRRFTDKMGLVYFGTVHPGDEGSRLVRGHTVSRTHIDNHYSVGSLRGYDVALVMRNDVVLAARTQQEFRCHWVILTVDLHTGLELPHMYIGHKEREEAFKASFERLSPLYIGGLAPYPAHFLSEYTVYGNAGCLFDIERTVPPQAAKVIAEHFDNASIEIEENTIYLYIESARPTEAQIEKLLSNGLWLAETIDTNASALYCEVPEKQ